MKKKLFIYTLLTASLLCFTRGAEAQETERLFNGKDLSNWNFIIDKNEVPAEQVYTIRDGKIYITGQPFGYMYTKKTYKNYKLHVEWRWPNGDTNANSGIFLHITETKNPFPNGIECNLQAGKAGLFVLLGGADLIEYQQRPGEERPFFPIVKNINPCSENAAGEWNEANIFVKDGVITTYINGVYQNTGTNKIKEGHIGLQSEGKEVEFRNVTLTKW